MAKGLSLPCVLPQSGAVSDSRGKGSAVCPGTAPTAFNKSRLMESTGWERLEGEDVSV